MTEAEQRAVEINQDWQNETTRFTFKDGSTILVCNNYATTHG